MPPVNVINTAIDRSLTLRLCFIGDTYVTYNYVVIGKTFNCYLFSGERTVIVGSKA